MHLIYIWRCFIFPYIKIKYFEMETTDFLRSNNWTLTEK